MARISKTDRLRKYKGLVAFLRAHPKAQHVLVVDKRLSPAKLAALLEAYLEAAARTASALAVYRQAVAAEAKLLRATHGLDEQVRNVALNLLGSESPKLAAYGIKPPKKGTKSLETLVAQAEKARATRKARGTMGKRQRAALERARRRQSE